MQAIPIPPPIPFAGGFVIPEPVLVEPTGQAFQWQPVPMYIENIPKDIPTPSPRPTLEQAEEAEAEEEEERQAEEEQKEGQAEGQKEKTETKAQPTMNSGKPLPPAPPPMDLVPELAEVQTVEIPFVGVEVPLPRTEILVTATTTAGVSSVVAVGGTLFATTLFRQLQPILKPIFKFAFKKIAALRKKPPPLSWARERRLKRRLKA